MINVIGYTSTGIIEAIIDDLHFFIPDNIGNMHRQLISEWEALGNTIPPYVEPDVNPLVVLKPYQFWTAVRAASYEEDLNTWVAGMEDPVQKAMASSILEFSLEFRYDHPFIEMARTALAISELELQTLWIWAASL